MNETLKTYSIWRFTPNGGCHWIDHSAEGTSAQDALDRAVNNDNDLYSDGLYFVTRSRSEKVIGGYGYRTINTNGREVCLFRVGPVTPRRVVTPIEDISEVPA